jgi:hypothetical protein
VALESQPFGLCAYFICARSSSARTLPLRPGAASRSSAATLSFASKIFGLPSRCCAHTHAIGNPEDCVVVVKFAGSFAGTSGSQ